MDSAYLLDWVVFPKFGDEIVNLTDKEYWRLKKSFLYITAKHNLVTEGLGFFFFNHNCIASAKYSSA